jgi:hypothetical protein
MSKTLNKRLSPSEEFTLEQGQLPMSFVSADDFVAALDFLKNEIPDRTFSRHRAHLANYITKSINLINRSYLEFRNEITLPRFIPFDERNYCIQLCFCSDDYSLPSESILPRNVKRKLCMTDLVGIELNPGPSNLGKLVNSLMGPNSRPIKKSKSAKAKKVRKTSKSANNNKLSMSAIPSGYGFVAPETYFRTNAKVQSNAEQDPRNGVRAEGCALFTQVGINSLVPTAAFFGGLSNVNDQDNGFVNLTPSIIDPRLSALALTYQYYAFRKIRVIYMPSVSTTVGGMVHLGISKDSSQASIAFNVATPGAVGYSNATPQQVLEYDPSLMSTSWQPAEMEFLHRGTSLWETYPNGEEPTDSRIQATLVAIIDSLASPPSSATQLNLGKIWLQYEIDFYIPGPPSSQTISGPTLFKRFPDQVGVSTPAGTAIAIGTIESNEVPSGLAFVNFEVGSTVTSTAQLRARNTVTNAVMNIGTPVALEANATQYSLSYAVGTLAAIAGAGIAYAAVVLELVPVLTTVINIVNSFTKSA